MDQTIEGRLVRLETKQERILEQLAEQHDKLDTILTLLAYVRGGAWVLLGIGGVIGTAFAGFTHLKKFLFG